MVMMRKLFALLLGLLSTSGLWGQITISADMLREPESEVRILSGRIALQFVAYSSYTLNLYGRILLEVVAETGDIDIEAS